MNRSILSRMFLMVFSGWFCLSAYAQNYDVKLQNNAPANGFVRCGKEIVFTATALKDGTPLQEKMFLEVTTWVDYEGNRKILVPADKPYTYKVTLKRPGGASVVCRLLQEKNGKKVPVKLLHQENRKRYTFRAGLGVVAEPEKHRIIRKEPSDFDLWWKKQIAQAGKTPLKVLEKKSLETPARYAKNFSVWDVKVSCATPKPVSGILTVPKDTSRKYPAVVSYHGAGVFSSSAQYRYGAISFDVNAHGIKNNQKKEYYTFMRKKGRLYRSTDHTVFLHMFLRVLQALEYVKSLPEWNGKDLIVTGGSQGGIQSIVAGALDKNVTLVVCNIPAMIGMGEILCGEKNVRSAWPNPYTSDFQKGKDVTAIARQYDYLDGAFLLRRVQCPIYISVGLWDFHSAHVFAAFRDCPSKEKHLSAFPWMGHLNHNPAGSRAMGKRISQANPKQTDKK